MQIKANLCEIPIFHRDFFEKGRKRGAKGTVLSVPLCLESKVHRTFGVSVSETMAARGLVNGRGPLRSSGRDSAKRVVSDTDTPKVLLEEGHR